MTDWRPSWSNHPFWTVSLFFPYLFLQAAPSPQLRQMTLCLTAFTADLNSPFDASGCTARENKSWSLTLRRGEKQNIQTDLTESRRNSRPEEVVGSNLVTCYSNNILFPGRSRVKNYWERWKNNICCHPNTHDLKSNNSHPQTHFPIFAC